MTNINPVVSPSMLFPYPGFLITNTERAQSSDLPFWLVPKLGVMTKQFTGLLFQNVNSSCGDDFSGIDVVFDIGGPYSIYPAVYPSVTHGQAIK